MNSVKIRKSGSFYNVFDDDCYILYLFFDYNIKNNKIGFPKSALTKVINRLDEAKIDYIVDEGSEAYYKKLNKYDKYVRLGKEKYNKAIKYKNIIDKIYNVSETKLDRILESIEQMLDE